MKRALYLAYVPVASIIFAAAAAVVGALLLAALPFAALAAAAREAIDSMNDWSRE